MGKKGNFQPLRCDQGCRKTIGFLTNKTIRKVTGEGRFKRTHNERQK